MVTKVFVKGRQVAEFADDKHIQGTSRSLAESHAEWILGEGAKGSANLKPEDLTLDDDGERLRGKIRKYSRPDGFVGYSELAFEPD